MGHVAIGEVRAFVRRDPEGEPVKPFGPDQSSAGRGVEQECLAVPRWSADREPLRAVSPTHRPAPQRQKSSTGGEETRGERTQRYARLANEIRRTARELAQRLNSNRRFRRLRPTSMDTRCTPDSRRCRHRMVAGPRPPAAQSTGTWCPESARYVR